MSALSAIVPKCAIFSQRAKSTKPLKDDDRTLFPWKLFSSFLTLFSMVAKTTIHNTVFCLEIFNGTIYKMFFF